MAVITYTILNAVNSLWWSVTLYAFIFNLIWCIFFLILIYLLFCFSGALIYTQPSFTLISFIFLLFLFRSFGVHMSKVRSVTLDAWEPELLKVMAELGNKTINSIYEACPDESIAKRASPRCQRWVAAGIIFEILAIWSYLKPGLTHWGRGDIFKCIFFNENLHISIKISLKLVAKCPIDNNPGLV